MRAVGTCDGCGETVVGRRIWKMTQILYKDIIKNKEINEFIKKGDAN